MLQKYINTVIQSEGKIESIIWAPNKKGTLLVKKRNQDRNSDPNSILEYKVGLLFVYLLGLSIGLSFSGFKNVSEKTTKFNLYKPL